MPSFLSSPGFLQRRFGAADDLSLGWTTVQHACLTFHVAESPHRSRQESSTNNEFRALLSLGYGFEFACACLMLDVLALVDISDHLSSVLITWHNFCSLRSSQPTPRLPPSVVGDINLVGLPFRPVSKQLKVKDGLPNKAESSATIKRAFHEQGRTYRGWVRVEI
eukprot:3033027-Amphidinium_carterae.1